LSILDSKRVLITGGTGHIGSHLIAKLASESTHLLVVARNKDKLDQLKKTSSASNIEVFPCDLTQPQDVARLRKHTGNIDLFVHLASYVPKISAVQDDALSSAQNNVVATANVLNHFGPSVKKICLASTAEVYGLVKYLPIDECHPAEPQTYYGAGKLAAEKYTKVFSQRNNCPTMILRFASVYGPGETIQRAIPNFIGAALKGSSPVIYGKGLDLRDYVYIDDAVEAIVLALQKKSTGGTVYNIASGQGYKIKEVAQMIVQLSGGTQPLDYRPATKPAVDYLFDISAAQKDLGYLPKTDLREGLQREIAWFKSRAKVEP